MDHLARILRRDSPKEAAYRASCTLVTCPLDTSYYAYRPSLATNAALLALFSLSLCGFILQAALVSYIFAANIPHLGPLSES